MVGDKPAEEPHELDVAPGLALQPSARLHPVQVAVDVELEQNSRVIGWATRRGRHHAGKAQRRKIQSFHERFNDVDRVVLLDPIVEALG